MSCGNVHLINSTELQCEVGVTVVGQSPVVVSLNDQASNDNLTLSRLCGYVQGLRVAVVSLRGQGTCTNVLHLCCVWRDSVA